LVPVVVVVLEKEAVVVLKAVEVAVAGDSLLLVALLPMLEQFIL
jgi:hypothetical protein